MSCRVKGRRRGTWKRSGGIRQHWAPPPLVSRTFFKSLESRGRRSPLKCRDGKENPPPRYINQTDYWWLCWCQCSLSNFGSACWRSECMLPPSAQIEYSTSSVPETFIPVITSPFLRYGFGLGLNYFASDLTRSKHGSTLFQHLSPNFRPQTKPSNIFSKIKVNLCSSFWGVCVSTVCRFNLSKQAQIFYHFELKGLSWTVLWHILYLCRPSKTKWI